MSTGLSMTDSHSAPSSSLRRLRVSHYLLLIFICLVSFLPGIGSIPPLDRDESRYVQATHQMAESGDYVDIRFQDASRYKKPIGIYWLQSAALKLTGHDGDAPIWVLPAGVGGRCYGGGARHCHPWRRLLWPERRLAGWDRPRRNRHAWL